MSRGTTPAILAMLERRSRDKLRCVIRLRYGADATPGTRLPGKSAPPLS
jgi:hypothetical protein